MANNLATMGICAPQDPRQKVGEPYTIPDQKTRELRAKLILEEALETIYALGFGVVFSCDGISVMGGDDEPDLEGIIDGCCDLNYVLTGTLVSCGVPDNPHYAEVNRANLDKFPGGKAIFNESGKFLKPEGWIGPDHDRVRKQIMDSIRNPNA